MKSSGFEVRIVNRLSRQVTVIREPDDVGLRLSIRIHGPNPQAGVQGKQGHVDGGDISLGQQGELAPRLDGEADD